MGMGWFQKIGVWILSAKGWYLFWLSAPTIWAFVSGVMDGLYTSEIILIVMGVLALSSAFSYYTIQGYDYFVKTRGRRKELNALADELQNMLNTGFEFLPIEEIAGIWAGDQTNKWHFTQRMRRIRTAARAGKIRSHKQGNEKIGQVTPVYIEDVIKVLRGGDI